MSGMSLLVAGGVAFKKLKRACNRCSVSLDQQVGTTTLVRKEWREVEKDSGLILNSEPRVEMREVLVSAEFDRWTLGGFPGVAGFEFLCRIEHTAAGNIVSGPESVPGWKDAKPTCDHCQVARRRNDTFVLRSASGEVVRVGRNCLGDFLRQDPTTLVQFSEVCRLVAEGLEDGEGFGGGSFSWAPETLVFLACAVVSVDRYGFKKSGDPASTKDHASFLAGPMPNGKSRAAWKLDQPTVAHIAKAEVILKWLQVDCANNASDYLSNLHVVSQLQTVSGRHEGLLASAPAAWSRATEAERQKAGLVASEWLGELKARVEFEGVLLRRIAIEGHFGTKYLHVFRTDSGSDVAWFCSGHLPRRSDSDPWSATLEAGDRVRVKGTVREHDTYKGRKQTTMTRCAVTYLGAAEASKAA